MPAADIKFSDSKMCLAWWNNLQITDMRDAIARSHVDVMEKQYHALYQSFPKGIIGVSTVHAGVPPSDAATAKRGGEILRELGPKIKHVSVVILDSGIKGTAIRILMRTINVISRSAQLVRVHDSVHEAATAIALVMNSMTEQSVSPHDVWSAINDVRKAYAAMAQPQSLAR